MGFLSSVKSVFGGDVEQKSASFTVLDINSLLTSTPTASGAVVNSTTALHVPAVYSAIALITGQIGSIPAKLYRRTEDGGKEAAKDHPAYRLVHDEANGFTSAGELRAKVHEDAYRFGNGFAFANHVAGRPYELVRLDPRSITIRYDETSGEPSYVQRTRKGIERTFKFHEILHIASPLDLSPIIAGKNTIATGMALERHAEQFFGSGARASTVITNDTKQTGETGANAINNIRKLYQKWQEDAAGEPLILDNGWKIDHATMPSTDAQFIENRRFAIEDVARLFRVPPPMLFDLEKSSYAKAEHAWLEFKTVTLQPWLDKWSWAYARCLLTPEERAAGYYIEFVTDDLLTADMATRATVYGQYRAMGVMSANNVRDGLNMPRVDGGDELTNPHITTTTTGPAAVPAKDSE